MDYKKLILFVVTIVLLFCYCQKEEITIVYFRNTTNDTIAIANPFMTRVEMDAADWFMDTKEIRYSIYLCPPNMKKSIFGWFDKDKHSATAKDTFVCYAMSKFNARSCNWDSISKYNKVLYKYVLSLDDLEQLNYNLSYPPNSSVE